MESVVHRPLAEQIERPRTNDIVDQSRTRCRHSPTGAGTVQEAARRAVREFVARSNHRDRVARAADLIKDTHSDALRRLGE